MCFIERRASAHKPSVKDSICGRGNCRARAQSACKGRERVQRDGGGAGTGGGLELLAESRNTRVTHRKETLAAAPPPGTHVHAAV